MSLQVLATNRFIGLPDGNVFSWCPRMDLLAVSMNRTSIWMFRLDGERVYSINNTCAIVHLRWNDSGRFFAVSGADNLVNVYESNTGKLVNKFASNASLPITLTNWCSIDVATSVLGATRPQFQDMFKVDVLKGMPKLSNEVDAMAESTAPGGAVPLNPASQPMSTSVTNTTDNDATMDYLLVVNSNVSMSVTFNNLFTVSDIALPQHYKFLKHAMGKDLFAQYFLMEDPASRLHLQRFRLALRNAHKRKHLLNVVRWCSQSVSMVNHILDQLGSVTAEARSFLDLYDRYLANYKDTLYADVDLTTAFPHPLEVEDTIVNDLTDMLLTGLVPETSKDFWLNQFGERGLLRLSTAGNAVYDAARKTLFTQIILALEKLLVLLSYLDSVARSEKLFQRDTMGISVDSLKAVIESSKQLAIKFYAFVWKINEEQESFNKFLNWCKIEVIEKLAKGENDPDAFFNAHPTCDFKTSAILEYFDRYMLEPVFLEFLDISDGNREVLLREPETETLQQQVMSLQEAINGTLLKGIQEYIAENVEYDTPIELDVSTQGMCDMDLFGATCIVTAVNDRVLSMLLIEDSAITQRSLDFLGTIRSYKMVDKDALLVLLAEGEAFTLNLVHITGPDFEIVKSLSFDANSSVKTPTYLTINSTEDKSHIIGSVLDASKKVHVVFEL